MSLSPKITIPYGRQWLDEEDIAAVTQVLRSDWLTTGPKVGEFEDAVAQFVGTRHGVALSSGTAALHAAMYAIGIGPGDEVIVPAMTFLATANAVVFQGGTPVFADVEPDTLLLDPHQVEAKVTARTKALIAVDYAGQPCDYNTLRAVAQRHGLALVADACHSLGGAYRDQPVGTLADLSVFSFHPVKHITTGEGGMVVTDNPLLAERMSRFRNHGAATDARQRAQQGTWYYEMLDLGYNYRLTDFQCALGLTQLKKLSGWLQRRRAIAQLYGKSLQSLPAVSPLAVRPQRSHAYHLYVILLALERLQGGRAQVFGDMRAAGIGVNVHYLPVHLHPFYRHRFHTGPGDCPVAEQAYERLLTLPLFPALTDDEVNYVVAALHRAVPPHP
jgi:perosamine synthetase